MSLSGIGNLWLFVASSFQHIFLVARQNIPFPKEIDQVRRYLLILFNLDFSISQYLPKELDWVWYVKFDFRLQFVLLCCLIPTVISYLLLMQFGDNLANFSFLMFAFGSITTIIGFYSSMENEWLFMLGGMLPLCFGGAAPLLSTQGVFLRVLMDWCLKLFCIFIKSGKGPEKLSLDPLKQVLDSHLMKERQVGSFHVHHLVTLLRLFGTGVTSFVMGLFFCGILRLNYFSFLLGRVDLELIWRDSQFFWLFPFIGSLWFLSSIYNAILFILICLKPGRKLILYVQDVFRAFTVRGLLFILFLLYTPIIATLVSTFVCDTVHCPPGTHARERHLSDYSSAINETETISPLFHDFERLSPQFADHSFRETVSAYWGLPPMARNNWTYDPLQCVSCGYGDNQTHFPGDTEVERYVHAFSTCPSTKLSVLYSDPTIPCTKIMSYFTWAGAILLVCWLSLPLLIVLIVTIVTKTVEKIPVEEIELMKPKPKDVIGRLELSLVRIQDKVMKVVTKPIPKKVKDFYNSPEHNLVHVIVDRSLSIIQAVEYLCLSLVIGCNNKIRPKNKLRIIHTNIGNVREYLRSTLKKQAAERWNLRIALLKNKVKEIYGSYEFRMRYWLALELCFKAIITSISVGLVKVPMASVLILTILHLGIVVFWVFFQPYIIFFNDVISFSMSFIVLLNHFWFLFNLVWVPPAWMYAILLFNILLPILGIIGTILFCLSRTGRLNIRKSDDRYQHVKDDVEKADATINKYSIQLITSFFFPMALMCMLIMAFNFVAFDNRPSNYLTARNYVNHENCEAAREFEYAGYTLFHLFSAECSCQEDPYFDHRLFDWSIRNHVQSELWHCPNGKKKIRLRVEKVSGAEESGLKIRPICSRYIDGLLSEIRPICVKRGSGYTYIVNTTSVLSTEYARENLW